MRKAWSRRKRPLDSTFSVFEKPLEHTVDTYLVIDHWRAFRERCCLTSSVYLLSQAKIAEAQQRIVFSARLGCICSRASGHSIGLCSVHFA